MTKKRVKHRYQPANWMPTQQERNEINLPPYIKVGEMVSVERDDHQTREMFVYARRYGTVELWQERQRESGVRVYLVPFRMIGQGQKERGIAFLESPPYHDFPSTGSESSGYYPRLRQIKTAKRKLKRSLH